MSTSSFSINITSIRSRFEQQTGRHQSDVVRYASSLSFSKKNLTPSSSSSSSTSTCTSCYSNSVSSSSSKRSNSISGRNCGNTVGTTTQRRFQAPPPSINLIKRCSERSLGDIDQSESQSSVSERFLLAWYENAENSDDDDSDDDDNDDLL
jgi:hypothetical protein